MRDLPTRRHEEERLGFDKRYATSCTTFNPAEALRQSRLPPQRSKPPDNPGNFPTDQIRLIVWNPIALLLFFLIVVIIRKYNISEFCIQIKHTILPSNFLIWTSGELLIGNLDTTLKLYRKWDNVYFKSWAFCKEFEISICDNYCCSLKIFGTSSTDTFLIARSSVSMV